MPKRDTVLAALGQNVRQRRESRELTQEKLAERAGLDAFALENLRWFEQTVACIIFLKEFTKRCLMKN